MSKNTPLFTTIGFTILESEVLHILLYIEGLTENFNQVYANIILYTQQYIRDYLALLQFLQLITYKSPI